MTWAGTAAPLAHGQKERNQSKLVRFQEEVGSGKSVCSGKQQQDKVEGGRRARGKCLRFFVRESRQKSLQVCNLEVFQVNSRDIQEVSRKRKQFIRSIWSIWAPEKKKRICRASPRPSLAVDGKERLQRVLVVGSKQRKSKHKASHLQSRQRPGE